MSSELDLGLVTSLITGICLIIFGYVTGDAIGKNEVIGLAGAIAGLIVWYYNEKHTSDLVSGNGEINTERIIADEADLINPDYYEEENEV
jgi:hypothetical protein